MRGEGASRKLKRQGPGGLEYGIPPPGMANANRETRKRDPQYPTPTASCAALCHSARQQLVPKRHHPRGLGRLGRDPCPVLVGSRPLLGPGLRSRALTSDARGLCARWTTESRDHNAIHLINFIRLTSRAAKGGSRLHDLRTTTARTRRMRARCFRGFCCPRLAMAKTATTA